MKKPTPEQCSNHEITREGCKRWLACWYPQMGGYGAECLVELPETPDDCFDVIVWHDGTFPFSEGDERSPARLHHCQASQFVRFGELVMKASKE